jgi:hypothetical protein
MAKRPYHDVRLEGNVESDFLYATLLSTDLLPFGHLDYRLVVLPIKPKDDYYELIDKQKAHEEGLYGLEKWLEKAEVEWTKRRGLKAEQMNIYERLDRVHGLTHQKPLTKYRVVYPDINRVMLASLICIDAPIQFLVGGQTLEITHYVTDHKNYVYETNQLSEALYICTVLNSAISDALLGSLRKRDQRGHPDVHKKIFDVAPIPKFDSKNTIHTRLAEIGEKCIPKVKQWLASGGAGKIKSIGKLRGMVRNSLSDELKEIDNLVKQIL